MERNVKLSYMTNFDVSMMSCLNFVTDKPKILRFSILVHIFSDWAEIWYRGQFLGASSTF